MNYFKIDLDKLPENAKHALASLPSIGIPMEELANMEDKPAINLGKLMTAARALDTAFDLLQEACGENEAMLEDLEELYGELAKPLIINAYFLNLTKITKYP